MSANLKSMESIRNHPFAVAVILVVSTAGITWTVAKEILVEPRDFEIERLLNENESLKTFVPPTQSETLVSAHAPATTNRTAAEPSPGEVIEFLSLSMAEFFSEWKNGDLTDLQKATFEKSLIGQGVVWEGYIQAVGITGLNDELPYIIFSEDQSSFRSTFCSFQGASPRDLQSYGKGQKLRFSGVISRFYLGPYLDNCSIISNDPN